MFGFFGSSPKKKLEKEYKKKLTESMNAQRSGDIQGYAKLNSEADAILQKIQAEENKK
ncbi:MAG: DUF6435 family protein [Lentisphaeraceae bacterium]|nr:DUF6435 family protein [Lentisphaeraceae bacterium]